MSTINSVPGSLFGSGNGGNYSTDDPIKAQKEFAHQQAWVNAITSMDKIENDGKSAKASGIVDSYTKQITAMTENAKNIRL